MGAQPCFARLVTLRINTGVYSSSQAPWCRELSEDGGLTLVKLCDGFGIPDHLLQAPIAFDWRLIGADVSM